MQTIILVPLCIVTWPSRCWPISKLTLNTPEITNTALIPYRSKLSKHEKMPPIYLSSTQKLAFLLKTLKSLPVFSRPMSLKKSRSGIL